MRLRVRSPGAGGQGGVCDSESVGRCGRQRDGEVVDNPRRPHGTAGNGDTTTLSELRSCDVVRTTFPPQSAAQAHPLPLSLSPANVHHTTSRAPRLLPFFVAFSPDSVAPQAALHRRGLSTTSSLRDSAAVTGLKDRGLSATRRL